MKKILSAVVAVLAMTAPTAVNKQPWHFVAVTSKDKPNYKTNA
jgi:nitroreductase